MVRTIKTIELTWAGTIDVKLGQGCPEVEEVHPHGDTNHRPVQHRDRVIGRLKMLKGKILCLSRLQGVLGIAQMHDVVPFSLILHKSAS